MARLADNVTQALGYWWNLVSDAANLGMTTTDTISAAASIARDQGRSLAFTESSAIATLYGYANRMQRAQGIFQGAEHTDFIMPEMIGTPPWARDMQEQSTFPMWHATFQFTYIDQEGNMVTDYRTSVFKLTLPDTVGGLVEDITTDAMAMAAKYGVQFVSATPHELLSV